MGVFDIFKKKEVVEPSSVFVEEPVKKLDKEMRAHFGYGFFTPLTGEKTMGELGILKQYYLSPERAAMRSWQVYNESDIAQIIINRYVGWVVGAGLRLESKPIIGLIKSEEKAISEEAELRFRMFSKNKSTSWNSQMNLNELTETAIKNAKLGGDVLIHLYTENERVKIRLIDTAHMSGINAIEKNEKGEHIAYNVRVKNGETSRLLAKDKQGRLVTWLYYGRRNRIDDDRGIPLLTVILESINSIDRYKTATVTGAEERAKVAIFAEHTQHSDGENPLGSSIKGSIGILPSTDSENVNSYSDVELQKTNIAKTTAKTMINMPVGSTLKSIESDQEFNFPDFFKANTGIVCAAVNIPSEVAFMRYESNFSASRAALKDWESSILDERQDVTDQFLQPVYDYWLDVEIIQGRIKNEGYTRAIITKDQDMLQAYRGARFLGKTVPHIDPLKEVQAERLKLGDLGAGIPLTTPSRSAEVLNSGDWKANAIQFKEELELSPRNEENNQTAKESKGNK